MLAEIINPGKTYTTICMNDDFIRESGLSNEILSKADSSKLFNGRSYKEIIYLKYKFITKIKSSLVHKTLFVLYNEKFDVYVVIGSEGVSLKKVIQLELFDEI